MIASNAIGNASTVEELALTTANSGTFTVLIGDGSAGGLDGTGTYRLYFARFPGAFIVADEGGAMTNGANHDGAILLGDLDLWRFTACSDDSIKLRIERLNEMNAGFDPLIRLHGPNGALLVSRSGLTNAEIAVVATNSGAFTVLVSDGPAGNLDGTGSYRLMGNGLSDGLKICVPIISGDDLDLSGAGGEAGEEFAVLTSPLVEAPLATWTPLFTNVFDFYGTFNRTSRFISTEPRRFYILRQR